MTAAIRVHRAGSVPANDVEVVDVFECGECLGFFHEAEMAPRGTYDVCKGCLPTIEARVERARREEEGCAGCGFMNCVCCAIAARNAAAEIAW